MKKIIILGLLILVIITGLLLSGTFSTTQEIMSNGEIVLDTGVSCSSDQSCRNDLGTDDKFFCDSTCKVLDVGGEKI